MVEGSGAFTLSVDPHPLPKGLPASLTASNPWRRHDCTDAPGVASDPVVVFITVDTEDTYFTRPHLITGDGIGPESGVFGILDELDARRMRATFFVNVFESTRQPPGAVREVVEEIVDRGHEVGLHSHPSPALDFYSTALFRLPRKAQLRALHWGVELLEQWTGKRPRCFRAGAYALNEETFLALEDLGIEIDSSCFFPSANNQFTRFTVNRVVRHGNLIEVPVTTVMRLEEEGDALAQRKLDLDWLSTDQLSTALDCLANGGAGFAMFMMHSFSFLDKATRMPDDPRSSRAMFASETLFGRYAEVYGARPEMRVAFAAFLDAVDRAENLQVKTLGEASSTLQKAAAKDANREMLPVVAQR